MQPDSPDKIPSVTAVSKSPSLVIENIFAFSPNRDTLGGTAYLMLKKEGNILIDCPAWNQVNQEFLQQQGGVAWLFITHRGGIGKAEEIKQAFDCEIIIQEQEAYLLPGLNPRSFKQKFTIDSRTSMIWTPGHSPGSACLYDQMAGGVLFSGRHLLPNLQGVPMPLRTSKTFHWGRQINSLKYLLEHFTAETLFYLCPGANIGFLRGKKAIDEAYQRLSEGINENIY